MEQPLSLKVWRLHPSGVRIEPAEKTLQGTANESGVKWCGPYTNANKMGWWLYPPQDLDVVWNGGKDFWVNHVTEYQPTDAVFVRTLVQPGDQVNPDKWCPLDSGRTKYTWGDVDVGTAQIWTGCVLQTPPGWCIQVRSPINCRPQPYYIQEGILETDWMQYDIWINLVFTEVGKLVKLRRQQWPPLAQLIPVRREAYNTPWEIKDGLMERETAEGNAAFKYWIDYNTKKYGLGGKQVASSDGSITKDSTTYYKERMRCLGKGTEPKPEEIEPKPLPEKTTITPKLVKPRRRKQD